MTTAILLLMCLMFVIGGAVTVMVGRRAKELGIPAWLGTVIHITGVLVVIAGIVGAIVTLFL